MPKTHARRTLVEPTIMGRPLFPFHIKISHGQREATHADMPGSSNRVVIVSETKRWSWIPKNIEGMSLLMERLC